MSKHFHTGQVCDIGAQRGANVKKFHHTRQLCDIGAQRGARISERLSSDFDRRVRSESSEVAFPFQSFPDNGESVAVRIPATVHPPSGRRVEFNRGEYVSSEFVNRSSCPPTVPMSHDAVDVDRPHSAPVRWMRAMADKLDALWSAVNRNMAMSVAGEGDGENSTLVEVQRDCIRFRP